MLTRYQKLSEEQKENAREATRRYRTTHRKRINKEAQEYQRLWRLKNPEHCKARARKYRENGGKETLQVWRKANAEHIREYSRAQRYKKAYGITVEEYEQKLREQGGHCALCPRTPEQDRFGNLCVDHDHDTGALRGILCHVCNSGLGKLGDNEAGLLRALAYVRQGWQS